MTRRRLGIAIVTVGALATVPSTVAAHFKLIAPASWVVENDTGDPQKQAPCGGVPPAPFRGGGTAPAPTNELTNAISKVVGGTKLHIKIQETVYHPGHYRVALAVNSRTELPPDPMAFERMTERGAVSVWGVIQSPPQIPVLADGLFTHYTAPPRATPGTTAPPVIWETDVDIPNINCPKCTLQVVQFMAEHGYNQPGGYSYHHCADLQIAADAAKPIDQRWPVAK
jgi:hypothetical protein